MRGDKGYRSDEDDIRELEEFVEFEETISVSECLAILNSLSPAKREYVRELRKIFKAGGRRNELK